MSTVDVYTIRLEADAARLEELWRILSPAEQQRASRYLFAHHRRQFIVCRGTVRQILSRYVTMDPARIDFFYNRYGKPSLPDSVVRFNVSRSGDWAMLAATTDCETGLDLERIDSRFAREQVPEHFFSPLEVKQLRGLAPAEQTAAFFRCWTRKEAYIKALGFGLALPLHSFDVSLTPDDPPELFRGASNWSVQDLPAPAGYAAAIVAAAPDFQVALYPVTAAAGVQEGMVAT